MKKVVFFSYHQRDYRYYSKVSVILKKNYKIYIICFHDFNINKVEKDLEVINFYAIKLNNIKKYKFKVREIYYRHEFINSDLSISKLKSKYQDISFKIYFYLSKIRPDIVIHEIGGFVVHHAIFETCKMINIKHLFIEPSPLKKYCLILKNTWNLDVSRKVEKTKKVKLIINKYVKYLKTQKYLAINKKDLHFDKNIFLLITNFKTANIFLRKFLNKILRKKVIFDNLFFFMFFFFKRAINYFFNFSYKYSVADNNPFFALQAPYDFALTNRAYESFNQISKLKSVVRNEKVMMKEHPLYKDVYRYKKELKNNSNLNFISPFLNANSVIFKSKFVISINSKAGLEALILGKPVCCLTKNYYTGKNLAFVCNSNKDYNKFKKKIISYKPNKKSIDNLLYQIFNKAFYFDLFSTEKNEIYKSAKSIRSVINENI